MAALIQEGGSVCRPLGLATRLAPLALRKRAGKRRATMAESSDQRAGLLRASACPYPSHHMCDHRPERNRRHVDCCLKLAAAPASVLMPVLPASLHAFGCAARPCAARLPPRPALPHILMHDWSLQAAWKRPHRPRLHRGASERRPLEQTLPLAGARGSSRSPRPAGSRPPRPSAAIGPPQRLQAACGAWGAPSFAHEAPNWAWVWGASTQQGGRGRRRPPVAPQLALFHLCSSTGPRLRVRSNRHDGSAPDLQAPPQLCHQVQQAAHPADAR